jgi:serine/threonine protein kinase
MSSGAGEGYIGKSFNFRHSGRVVTVQSVLGEGGFSLVFLVTTPSNQRYALKRMCVNNEHDLESCRREIAIVVSLSLGEWAWSLKYVASVTEIDLQWTQECCEIRRLYGNCAEAGHLRDPSSNAVLQW